MTVRDLAYKQYAGRIDVSDLHDILSIDLASMRVRVEPGVNMGQLTRALLPLGVTLPVVPELEDLTAGGLMLGYGIEASSHRYGLFADTVLEAEVVTADGRRLTCSPGEHSDLFHALPWSYGAHGILTALTLPLIRCTSHVQLTYEPVRGLDMLCERLEELVSGDEPPEFVEGLMFSKDTSVILHGNFAPTTAKARVNPIGRWYKPWFYKHAESALDRGEFTELLPLRDWYHRHGRSLYWHGELLVPFGNHPLFRHTLGWLMPPKVSLLRLTQTSAMRELRDRRNVVQDALVPMEHLRAGIEMFHREFECYPLWLCAHRVPRTSPGGMIQPHPSVPMGGHEMYVDLGAWQVPGFVKRGEAWDGRRAVRNMEAWCRTHRSYQCLYAVTEQTRAELWRMFDPALYRLVRQRYGSVGVFMDLYDKVGRRDHSTDGR